MSLQSEFFRGDTKLDAAAVFQPGSHCAGRRRGTRCKDPGCRRVLSISNSAARNCAAQQKEIGGSDLIPKRGT